MKKVAIVFDHPYGMEAGYNEPHKRSFTSALLVALLKAMEDDGTEVDLIDLHKDNFNPVMSKQDLINWRTKSFVDPQSQDYFERLQMTDEIIMLFPIWWEVMPAMTKGFLDKVLAKGQIKQAGATRRLFASSTKVRVLTVSGAPTWIYRIVFGNPVIRMLKRGVFKKAGIKDFKWHNFNAEDTSPRGRVKMLKSVKKYI